MAKKTALLGMLVALAFVLSYIETLIPVNLGIPGAKLGLANLVVMVALYTLGTKEAFALSMVRILLTGLTFSSMAAMLYSFAGGLLSFAVMYLAKRSKLFSAAGVSVLGGISHNAGQIFVAMWVLDTAKKQVLLIKRKQRGKRVPDEKNISDERTISKRSRCEGRERVTHPEK